jgi:ATPase subunit of ABC transporter with duplicated ATPase domains
MSGGERVRAQLAKLLFNEPSFLLLDEPTNNLDLATIRWLESFICNAKVPVLFVSHDEALIRKAATGILYLANRTYDNKCFAYFSGEGYDDFLSRLHRSAEQAESDRVNLQREVKKLKKEHVERQNKVIGSGNFSGAEDAATKGRMMRAAASSSRSAASFGKKIVQKEEELRDFEVPHIETSVKLEFPQDCVIPASKTVLSLVDEKLEVGGRVLVPSFSLEVIGPQKVGIIGSNGAGKTTLLRKIQGMEMRPGIRLGYMPQDFNEVLRNSAESGLEILVNLGAPEHIARAFMSRMGFSRGEMSTSCGQLSGGQRGKLILMQTVLKGGNLLVLDEPTRNLSPITAPVLKEQLREYPGAVVLVSHDRQFLHDVCTRVYQLSNTGLNPVDKESLL